MAKAITKLTAEDALAHIFALRDLSIKLVRESGRWQRIGVTPVMCVEDHGNLQTGRIQVVKRKCPIKREEKDFIDLVELWQLDRKIETFKHTSERPILRC
jgi:hypothetical protein